VTSARSALSLIGRPSALVGAAAVAATAAPLFPFFTAGWPRSGVIPVLALAVACGTAGVLTAARGRLTPRALLIAGAFPLYALYTSNGVNLTSGDNLATRVLPSLLLTQGTLDLSNTPGFDGPVLPYAAVRSGGRVLNLFPSGTAFVALPHAALALIGSGGRVTPALVSRWEKHAAALITIAAAALLWASARRWGEGPALGAAAVFALATPVPANAAQALWSLTGEIFCLALALFLALRSRALPAWAGVAAGAAFACRPTALAGAIAILLAFLVADRQCAARFAAGLGAALTAVCAVQLVLYGHPLGAYGALNTAHGAFNANPARGLAGVLASPSRGLLIFCPWVLVLPLGLASARSRDDGLFVWSLASLAATVGTILVAATHVSLSGGWFLLDPGWCLGPRLMTEAAPFLALASIPFFREPFRQLRATFLALFAFAAVTQILLAYAPGAWEWDSRVHDPIGPRALWRWKDGQLAAAWGAPLPVIERPPATTPGGEDLTGSIDVPADGASAVGRLLVRGWARIPGTDVSVSIYLDGEARAPISATRLARPDVCVALPALGDCASAGYEVAFDFLPGDEGQHEILAIFRAPDGRVRRYPARSFVWKKD
jgi:hypothetical protein